MEKELYLYIMTNTKTTTTMKTYKLICNTFGHKFSFNAKNEEAAILKMKEWCAYHSHYPMDYKVEETTETKWIHNDYVN